MTVVLKLLNIVRADRAYFGEKDFQQLRIITKMVAEFFIPTEIVAVPNRQGSNRDWRQARGMCACRKRRGTRHRLFSMR